MSDTLTQFGTSFQAKIIASLMSDIKFLQTISDILEPSMFDSDSNKWLVKSIRDYYYEYKKQPTLEVIKYKVDASGIPTFIGSPVMPLGGVTNSSTILPPKLPSGFVISPVTLSIVVPGVIEVTG